MVLDWRVLSVGILDVGIPGAGDYGCVEILGVGCGVLRISAIGICALVIMTCYLLYLPVFELRLCFLLKFCLSHIRLNLIFWKMLDWGELRRRYSLIKTQLYTLEKRRKWSVKKFGRWNARLSAQFLKTRNLDNLVAIYFIIHYWREAKLNYPNGRRRLTAWGYLYMLKCRHFSGFAGGLWVWAGSCGLLCGSVLCPTSTNSLDYFYVSDV